MSVDVNKMVSNFLSWKLPEDFNPDGGIGFDPHPHANQTRSPSGTNLLNAQQAKEMIEFMLKDAILPNPDTELLEAIQVASDREGTSRGYKLVDVRVQFQTVLDEPTSF